MKLKKKIFAIIAYLSMMVGAVSLTVTFGWFDQTIKTGDDIYGESAGAYFAYGNGTQNKPYGISNQRHLYNLAWLQYLGKFNDKDFYFELANDINMNGLVLPPIGTTKYPFIGHFTGSPNNSGIIYQISNIVIANTKEQMTKIPEAVRKAEDFQSNNELSNLEAVGLFGCIGDIKDYDDDTVGTISDKDTPTLSSFKVSNIRIESKTNQTLAGVVAGYVNGTIKDVSINVSSAVSPSSITIDKSSSLTLGTKSFPATSEFTSIGYCEEEYKTVQYRSENQVYSPITKESFTFTAGGKENEWGGSLDMSAFTKRLDSLSSDYSLSLSPGEYSLEEKTTLDSIGKEFETTKHYFSTTGTYGSKDYTGYHYYENNVKNTKNYDSLIGSLNMIKTSNGSGAYVYYLNAGTRINEQAFTDESKSRKITTISYNNNYLAVSSDTEKLTTVNKNEFVWNIPLSQAGVTPGNIYARLNKKTFYLTIENDQLSLTTNSSSATSWTVTKDSSTNKYKITYGNYYINFNETTQQFILSKTETIKSSPFRIMAKNTVTVDSGTSSTTENRIYYLALGSTSLSDGKYYFDYQSYDKEGETTKEKEALEWYIGDSASITYSGSGTNYTCYSIYTTIGVTNYYLECQVGDNTYANKEFYLTTSLNSDNTKNHFIFDETNGYLKIIQSGSIRTLRHMTSNSWGWCYSSDKSSEDYSSEYAICYTGSVADFNDNNNVYKISTEYAKMKDTIAENESKKYQFTFSDVTFPVKSDYFEYDREDVSYLPINVDDNYEATENNTGYLVGGSDETYDKDKDGNKYYYPYGNVRVSNYGSKTEYLSDYLEIKAESLNPLTITINKEIENLNSSDFQKYTSAFNNFNTSILSDANSLYGLHFMDASISKDKLVTAKTARISENDSSGNNKYRDYTDYQLPANSLDFHLQSKGYINFFAGTYGNYYVQNKDNTYTTYYDNDSFFSLHEIIRESSDESKIKEIREIKTIYKTNEASGGYLYEYVNTDSNSTDRLFSAKFTYDKDANRIYESNTSKETLITKTSDEADKYLENCTLVFDTEQLGNRNQTLRKKINNTYTKRTFYFEIPVNDGEYALGSVDGGTGAYLMYLDIGSNATIINRTTIQEKFVQTKYSLEYPNGVNFTVDDQSKNFCVSLPKEFSGSLTIKYEDSAYNLSLSNSSAKATIGYYEDNTSFSSSISNAFSFDKGTKISSSEIVRQTFVDYNTNDGSLTKVIITDTDGNKTAKYYLNEKEVTANKVNIYIEQGEQYIPQNDINKIEVSYSGKNVIFTFSFKTEKEETITISYDLSLILNTADSTKHYYKDENYTITFTLNNNDVTITLTKKDGTSVSYDVTLNNGDGIRHQP